MRFRTGPARPLGAAPRGGDLTFAAAAIFGAAKSHAHARNCAKIDRSPRRVDPALSGGARRAR